jgi:hypothetical protein
MVQLLLVCAYHSNPQLNMDMRIALFFVDDSFWVWLERD